MTSLLWLTLRTFLPVVILIILLQLWSLKSDYQIREPYKWHSWSSVCVWNVNVQGIKWKLIWSTLFPLTKTQKRKWANTHYQAIMTSRLVNNIYMAKLWAICQATFQGDKKKIVKFAKRHMHINEQAPLLNNTFRKTLIFSLFPKCANGLYSGLCEEEQRWSGLFYLS